MRSTIVVVAACAAALVAASMLGVATAESPTVPPLRTISVEGVAKVPLAQGSDAAGADGAYRSAMAEAVADGRSKAEFLASKVGATLAAVQSVVEGGGSVSCTGGEGESPYVEYTGAEPDFGSPSVVAPGILRAAAGAAPVPPRAPLVRRRVRRKATAHKAAGTTCTVSATVALGYAIS